MNCKQLSRLESRVWIGSKPVCCDGPSDISVRSTPKMVAMSHTWTCPRFQGERNTYTEATCGKRGLSGRGAEAFVPAVAAYLKAQHPKTLFLVMVACCPLDSHDLVKSRLSALNVTCSIQNHPDRTFVENFPGGSKEVFALVFMVNEIVKSFDNP